MTIDDLKVLSLRFPLSRPSAWALSNKWTKLIEEFSKGSEKDKLEFFTVGFWFVEEVGKHGEHKDSGLGQCFTYLVRNFHTDKTVQFFSKCLFHHVGKISCKGASQKIFETPFISYMDTVDNH